VKHAFAATAVFAAAVAVTFLVLPVIALFVHVPPGRLVDALGSPAARDALVVSIKTSLIAHLAVLVVGTPAAYAIGRNHFRGRALILSLIELPLVVPPVVAGIALLVTFGRFGLLGGTLDALGLSVSFTQAAVVIAIAFVESPFYLRGAIASFESIDDTLLEAARTLGAKPFRVFARVAVPLAAGGLGAASALALARGLGEFGATLLFAGSLQGVTQTLPLAIYAQFEVDFDTALAIGALFVVFGIVVLLSLKLIPGWTRSVSLWPFRSASFPST
jgi:molybdate transport system permease protein